MFIVVRNCASEKVKFQCVKKACANRKLAYPTVNIVVGAVFVVNYRLVIAENVKTETVRRTVIVEENAGE